ncbi:CvpA family protein [Bacterioplanes sanyensis]|nr:CvpA family protein [Bacterioplanes sanyensis]
MITVVVVSSLISLKRGFVREALSLASWIIAFIVARLFSGNLATLLEGQIDTESLRWMVAFLILFAGTIIVGALLNHLIAELVRVTGLSGTDRVFGMVFGAVRGLLILVVAVYGLQYTLVPDDTWYQQSVFIPQLESVADWARKTLPAATDRLEWFSQ